MEVTKALAAAQPTRVLDVGCNTGVYSNLAADAGAEVVSVDTDLQVTLTEVRPDGQGPLLRAGSSGGASQAVRPAAFTYAAIMARCR